MKETEQIIKTSLSQLKQCRLGSIKINHTGRHANKMEEKKVTGKLPYEKAEMEVIAIDGDQLLVNSGDAGQVGDRD